jgi:predicted acetyltransferase
MPLIRPISEAEIDVYVQILANAYPGSFANTQEDRQRARQRILRGLQEDPQRSAYGLYDDGRLLGGLVLRDMRMTLLSESVPVGGIGMLAVDLLHKKQHVARDLVQYSLRRFRQRGAPLALLYPFRPDFYKRMGFGFGAKMHEYRLAPAALPAHGARERVRPLSKDDTEALRACYQRVQVATNGLIEKTDLELALLFENADLRVVGHQDGERLTGYLVFGFRHDPRDSSLVNDIQVREMIYETPAALAGLLAFLHSQADQVRRIIVTTQDEAFHHLFMDPRDGSDHLIPSVCHQTDVAGVGIMYRLVDVASAFRALQEHSFGQQTVRLRLTIADDFLPENAGSLVLHFIDGVVTLASDGDWEVEMRLSVADLSSLLVGAAGLRSLCRYGLAEVSDAAYVDRLHLLFAADPPQCMTAF